MTDLEIAIRQIERHKPEPAEPPLALTAGQKETLEISKQKLKELEAYWYEQKQPEH